MGILLIVSVAAWLVANIHLATCSLSNNPAKTYIDSIQLFGQKSVQAVHEKLPGNLIYSPAGVSTMLTMLAVGAKGETLEQIVRGLQIPRNMTRREVFNFVKGVNNSRGYELLMASKLFYNKDSTPNNSFIESSQKIFKAQPQGVDFGRPGNTSEIINHWCAAQTNQRIKKIIDPGDISDKTEILLLNAIYFKGDWKTPFNANDTKLRTFYVNGTTARKVETMQADRFFHYGYLDGFDAEWIELPYAVTPNTPPGNTLSMFIILPRRRDGLPDLMKNFHGIDLKSLRNGTMHSATIWLPKFKLESEIDLRKPLETLGVADMFTKNADLSGIIDGRQLSVDRVFQKALIEVNEEGTEATAATGSFIGPLSAGAEFIVEHPFVALIMKGDGTLIFTAVINDPGNDGSYMNGPLLSG